MDISFWEILFNPLPGLSPVALLSVENVTGPNLCYKENMTKLWPSPVLRKVQTFSFFNKQIPHYFGKTSRVGSPPHFHNKFKLQNKQLSIAYTPLPLSRNHYIQYTHTLEDQKVSFLLSKNQKTILGHF